MELINAATEVPFKEFDGSQGVDAYVEVEPGLEYFVRVKNNYPTGYVCSTIEVDGEDLGYNQGKMGKGIMRTLGLWSFNNTTSESGFTALTFHKAVSQSRSSRSNENNNSDVGTVKVSFYEEIILEGSHEEKDFLSKFDGTSQGNGSNQHESKKYLKSQPGKKRKLEHDDGRRSNYKFGRKLGTIKVRYCSTVGLIENGVLPKPPMWDWYKMIKPKCVSRKVPKLQIEPTPWVNEMRDNNGNVVKTVESDFFDLTALEDEKDENTHVA